MHLQAITSLTQNVGPDVTPSPSRARRYAIAITRFMSALALLGLGAIHIQQYIVADYRVIPTIGVLFLLNFIGGTVLGLYMLVPAHAVVGHLRYLADRLVALSGLGIAVTSLIALFISEQTPLFGFMEHGYRFVIVLAILSEAAAALALTAFLVLSHRQAARRAHVRRVDPMSVATATKS